MPGTGGSRNVLTVTGPGNETVYALVPQTEAAVAPFDPTFAFTDTPATGTPADPDPIAPGLSVTLSGGNGIPAGTYTLMPSMYATLPGAVRVVAISGTTNDTAAQNFTSPDGSQFIAGTFANAITGAHNSQSILFEVQSNAVWTRYSEIDITSGQTFFANQAGSNGTLAPPLPADAGHLEIGATNSLTFDATDLFTPATGGRGGEADISASNILVLAPDVTAPAADAAFLVLNSDQLSALGAASVLIGGTRTNTSSGTLIDAQALNVEIDTDAAHPLTGPELLFASHAPTSPNAADQGVTVDPGSVISAVGAVQAGTDQPIMIGADPVAQFNSSGTFTGFSTPVSGDGSMLIVSNGVDVPITRNFVPGKPTGASPEINANGNTVTPPAPAGSTPLGTLTINAATLSGNTLIFDSSGNTTLDS